MPIVRHTYSLEIEAKRRELEIAVGAPVCRRYNLPVIDLFGRSYVRRIARQHLHLGFSNCTFEGVYPTNCGASFSAKWL